MSLKKLEINKYIQWPVKPFPLAWQKKKKNLRWKQRLQRASLSLQEI
jgi:hypothetical protein